MLDSSFLPLLLLFLSFFPLSLCIAPVNPFLANSVWPLAQHDNYAQASTLAEGPLQSGEIDTLFLREVAGALTLLYTPDSKVVWGSSFTSVFKVDRTGEHLQLIDAIEKPESLRNNDTFRGIYSVLTKDDIFYLSSSTVISAYTDKEANNSLSGIKLIKSFDFTSQAREKERILALSLSYDGKLVFLTNQGGVGVLSLCLSTLHDFIYILPESKGTVVSNSMSVDEFGGIYVVSSRFMHRLWWDAARLTLHASLPNPSMEAGKALSAFGYGCKEEVEKTLCQVWCTPYPVDEEPIVGRPTKQGSGTTPSLLKDANTGRLDVMIADGRRQQHVLAIDSQTGQIIASSPVSFNGVKESYTEQSILVSGNKFLVTQNALTPPALRVNAVLELINAPKRVSNKGLPEFVEDNVYLLPVVLGDSPRGYQQFLLDTTASPAKITTTWIRSDVGCPNAIPTLSETSGVMYCVGKRTRGLGTYPLQGFTGGWTIEALNWHTGETVFREDTGHNVLYNSLYAATQIGPDKEIIYGSIGGLVRLRPTGQSKRLFEIIGGGAAGGARDAVKIVGGAGNIIGRRIGGGVVGRVVAEELPVAPIERMVKAIRG